MAAADRGPELGMFRSCNVDFVVLILGSQCIGSLCWTCYHFRLFKVIC